MIVHIRTHGQEPRTTHLTQNDYVRGDGAFNITILGPDEIDVAYTTREDTGLIWQLMQTKGTEAA